MTKYRGRYETLPGVSVAASAGCPGRTLAVQPAGRNQERSREDIFVGDFELADEILGDGEHLPLAVGEVGCGWVSGADPLGGHQR